MFALFCFIHHQIQRDIFTPRLSPFFIPWNNASLILSPGSVGIFSVVVRSGVRGVCVCEHVRALSLLSHSLLSLSISLSLCAPFWLRLFLTRVGAWRVELCELSD